MAATGTLLIVDDEPSIRRSLERLLRPEGYRIYSAENADAATTILESDDVDVILCDQDMPGKSGTEFLQETARRFPQQRRLMISGRFQSEDVAVAMDAGAIHKFMMKPWDDAILKADIRLSFRQLMEEVSQGKPSPSESVRPGNWEDYQEERKLIRELHTAANDGSLNLQYQPQVCLKTGAVSGVEALLRWTASIGPVRPDRFIAMAERSGAMPKLTHWVLCEVIYRAQCWLRSWSAGHISLNVSPSDLFNPGLVDYVEQLLALSENDASAIQIEVTESEVIDPKSGVVETLNHLQELGVGLAIDDFGAGATSLSYLANLPFSSIKLDRSLTQQLDTQKGVDVVGKVLEMSRCLGMTAVVEGVETKEQVDIATELGADVAQGYYFSKPLDRGAIETWVQSGAEGVPR